MKDWYLLTPQTRPNITGGFENDELTDFKEDAVYEAFDTDLASAVTLYDSSLNKIKDLKLIIQNNLANTLLNSMGREVIAPIGTLKAGMYIGFDNRYWIVTGYPGNNKVYEKAVMELCQCKIKWQKSDGTIIERWVNLSSASKYDVGIYKNNHITISSNNYTLILPEDDDCATLDDKRIFLDRDTLNPKKVFHITRSDDVLYIYGEQHGGIISFIADRTELNMLTDRPDLGLCDYIDVNESVPEIPQPPIKPTITIDGSDKLKLGFKATYKSNGITDNNFKWNIISDFKIENTSFNNDITLKVSDYKNIGKTFTLQLIVNEIVVSSKVITIVQAF